MNLEKDAIASMAESLGAKVSPAGAGASFPVKNEEPELRMEPSARTLTFKSPLTTSRPLTTWRK
jgi:hypothetical protein